MNKNGFQILRHFKAESMYSALISLIITFVIACIYRPSDQNAITSFNRQIGDSVLCGLDANKTILYFLRWYFLLAICFYLLYILIKKLFRIGFLNSANHFPMEAVLAVGVANISVKLLNPNEVYRIGEDSTTLLLLSIIFVVFFLKLKFLDKNSLIDFVFSLIFSSILLNFLFNRNQILLVGLATLFSLFVTLMFHKAECSSLLRIVFAVCLGFMAILIEGRNVLNQHYIFIKLSKLMFLMIFFVSLATLYFLRDKKIIQYFSKKLTGKEYIISVISLGIIMCVPIMTTVFSVDLFENASDGMLIYDFFHSHKLPMLESFSGRGLMEPWSNFLYGFINQDHSGTCNPYVVFNSLICLIIFYRLLRFFFPKFTSFFITMFFPDFLSLGFFNVFGLFLVFSTTYLLKNISSWRSNVLYWISVVFLFFLNIPIALSFFVGSIFVMLYVCIKKIIKIDYKKFVASFFVVLSPVVLVLLLKMNFDFEQVTQRILEVWGIVNSNLNWAYSTIGDVRTFQFPLFYIITPLLIIFIGYYQFLIEFRNKKMTEQQFFSSIVLSILIVSYFFNFTRTLGRHCLVEGFPFMILHNAVFIVPLFLTKFFKNFFKPLILVASMLVMVYFTYAQRRDFIFSNLSSFQKTILITKRTDNFYYYRKKMDRICVMDPEDKVKSIQKAIEYIIPENKTFLDFGNVTALYSFCNRKKPVFVNQSPGMLSGEFTQKMFLKQIKAAGNVDFAIMSSGVNICGVEGQTKYFRIAEYLSKNYLPLTKVKKYTILIKKSVLKNYSLAKIKKKYQVFLGDWTFGTKNLKFYEHRLEKLPYVWANYDEENAARGKIFFKGCVKNNQTELRTLSGRQKEFGNYLKLSINNKQNIPISVSLNLGNKLDGKLVTFKFVALPGLKKYLFRPSTDPYWHDNKLKQATVSKNVELKRLEILEGD